MKGTAVLWQLIMGPSSHPLPLLISWPNVALSRVLKDTIQTAQASQQPWKPVVTEILHSYRATPHAKTGESPFQLLRGRPIRAKLDILPPPKDNGQYSHVKAKVARQQVRSALYTNKKRGVKPTNITVGATVRVHKPFCVGKGEMQYSKPLSVQRHTGLSSFILTDGKRWKAARLSLCPESSTEAEEGLRQQRKALVQYKLRSDLPWKGKDNHHHGLRTMWWN